MQRTATLATTKKLPTLPKEVVYRIVALLRFSLEWDLKRSVKAYSVLRKVSKGFKQELERSHGAVQEHFASACVSTALKHWWGNQKKTKRSPKADSILACRPVCALSELIVHIGNVDHINLLNEAVTFSHRPERHPWRQLHFDGQPSRSEDPRAAELQQGLGGASTITGMACVHGLPLGLKEAEHLKELHLTSLRPVVFYPHIDGLLSLLAARAKDMMAIPKAHLKILVFSGVLLTSWAVRELLSSLSLVQELTLARAGLKDVPLAQLFSELSKSLRRLDLSGNNLATEQVAAAFLGELEALEDLDLSGNKIEWANRMGVGKSSGLRRLVLDDNPLKGMSDASDSGDIFEIFTLRHLSFQRVQISLELIGEIGDALAMSATLSSLDLSDCKLEDKHMSKLDLRRNDSLITIDLSSNKISDKGAWTVNANKSLRWIDLSGNKGLQPQKGMRKTGRKIWWPKEKDQRITGSDE